MKWTDEIDYLWENFVEVNKYKLKKFGKNYEYIPFLKWLEKARGN